MQENGFTLTVPYHIYVPCVGAIYASTLAYGLSIDGVTVDGGSAVVSGGAIFVDAGYATNAIGVRGCGQIDDSIS